MSEFKPFPALRPASDKVHLVASRSYISYNKRQLSAKLSENPYTFIHIINPEFQKGIKKVKDTGKRHQLIRDAYNRFVSDDVLVQDKTPCFYIYEQHAHGQSFTGIIGGASVEEYLKGHIKVHENTITKREQLFKRYLDDVGFNAEPVLLTYKQESCKLIPFMSSFKKKHQPVYDFSTTDKTRHKLWVVDKDADIEKAKKCVASLNDLYIADGHHRTSSSALLSLEKKGYYIDHRDHSYDYFMSIIIPKSELLIHEYNRLIKDLNGLSDAEFLRKVEKSCSLKKLKTGRKPKKKGEFVFYLNKTWLSVSPKEIPAEKGLNQMDPEVLNQLVLEPILNIHDLKKDKRVGFEGGSDAMNKVVKAVDSRKYRLGIFVYPVAIEEIIEVADNRQVMPPKSTWVEPKLRSGLTIYEIG